jgi:hypothetical protein
MSDSVDKSILTYIKQLETDARRFRIEYYDNCISELEVELANTEKYYKVLLEESERQVKVLKERLESVGCNTDTEHEFTITKSRSAADKPEDIVIDKYYPSKPGQLDQ